MSDVPRDPEHERIVIAGGGLSGLSMSAHLAAERGLDMPVLVVDDGRRPLGDRAWAFWSDRPGLLDAAVSHRFDRVRVHAYGRTRVLGLGRYRYQRVSGAALGATVARIVAGDPRFSVRHGHVERIVDEPRGARVWVAGEPLPARWVLDGVLRPSEPAAAAAYLVFHGWRVRAEAPVFDADVPTFFDFRTAQQDGASFMYVLPTDAHHALVEHTTFAAPDGHGRANLDAQHAALAEYLHTVVGAEPFVVLGEERGALPLLTHPVARRRGRHTLAIGVEGGMLKASTGYAYQRIQCDSAIVARSLTDHGHPFELPAPSRRHRFLDRTLLDVIIRDPRQLERAFAGLFRHASAEPVLRFLDEQTSWREERRLFAGMPVAPFVSAVARLGRR